jgi:hypothetical protein
MSSFAPGTKPDAAQMHSHDVMLNFVCPLSLSLARCPRARSDWTASQLAALEDSKDSRATAIGLAKLAPCALHIASKQQWASSLNSAL